MPNSLQLYLSPRPPRTNTSKDPTVKGVYNACTATFTTQNSKHYIHEEHHVSTHPKAQGGIKSQSGPPPHMHLYQNAYFECLQGVLGILCDGQIRYVRPGDAVVTVPKGSRYRFWAEEGGGETGSMKMRARVDEYPGGFDEKFTRNIFSYASDCETHGVPMSGVQLILFLFNHDMMLDLPFPKFVLYGLHWVIAYVIAQVILGYSSSYEEYWDEGSRRTEVKKEL